MRRIRRLFPALCCMVSANLIIAACILYPHVFRDYGKELIAQVTMISNVYFAQQDGYFATPSENMPLLHTWSLAVEEQFYLLFPFLLTWLWQKRSGRLPRILTVITCGSFLFNIIGTHYFTLGNFFLLPGRIWELLLGALIAVKCPELLKNSKHAPTLGWVALIILLSCSFLYDRNTPFPGFASLPVCLSASILIAVHSDTKQTVLSLSLIHI